jgi:hypothetical protein
MLYQICISNKTVATKFVFSYCCGTRNLVRLFCICFIFSSPGLRHLLPSFGVCCPSVNILVLCKIEFPPFMPPNKPLPMEDRPHLQKGESTLPMDHPCLIEFFRLLTDFVCLLTYEVCLIGRGLLGGIKGGNSVNLYKKKTRLKN